MSFLASDVMDDSAVILNDVGKSLFTYAAQLPYLQRANRDLEMLLINIGAPQQRVKSTPITVTAGTSTLTLPDDFLLPTSLKERAFGSSDPWDDMHERPIEPDDVVSQYALIFWAFRNNGIYFVAATTDREVLLQYERQLAAISSQNSPEDFILSRNYLGSKTAEYCARFVGMNTTIADGIRDNEVFRAEDALTRAIVLNGQGNRYRRKPFTSKQLEVR